MSSRAQMERRIAKALPALASAEAVSSIFDLLRARRIIVFDAQRGLRVRKGSKLGVHARALYEQFARGVLRIERAQGP